MNVLMPASPQQVSVLLSEEDQAHQLRELIDWIYMCLNDEGFDTERFVEGLDVYLIQKDQLVLPDD